MIILNNLILSKMADLHKTSTSTLISTQTNSNFSSDKLSKDQISSSHFSNSNAIKNLNDCNLNNDNSNSNHFNLSSNSNSNSSNSSSDDENLEELIDSSTSDQIQCDKEMNKINTHLSEINNGSCKSGFKGMCFQCFMF